MKVEIKEIKKERKDGWYKVKYADKQEIARYYNSSWYVVGIGTSIPTRSIKVLDNNPITFEETESKPEPFSPIELSLTIERKEELKELWHLLAIKRMENNINGKTSYTGGVIFKAVDEIMKKLNIKP